MTYIKNFYIEGLAGRSGYVEHALDRHTNIFWGLNGSGKTTVLQILEAAMTNSTRHLSTMPFKSASVHFYSESMDRDVIRTFTNDQKIRTYSEANEEYQVRSEISLGSDWTVVESDRDPGWDTRILGGPLEGYLEGREEHFRGTVYASTFLPISRVVGNAKRTGTGRNPQDPFVQRINEVWRQYSSDSLIEIEAVQRQGLASVLAILFGGRNATGRSDEVAINPAVGATQAFRVVSSFLMDQRLRLPLGKKDFERRYDESTENQQVVARIQGINAVVDEIRAPQHEFQNVLEEMYIGNKHIEFDSNVHRTVRTVNVTNGQESIPLSSLSSGEKQLLQILLETLAASSSAVLIDEPELSLHPDWQKRLVRSMRRVNSGAQFILATHSPDLMIHVPSRCVFEL